MQSERRLSWFTRFNSLGSSLFELIALPLSSWAVPLLIVGLCSGGKFNDGQRQEDLIRCVEERETWRDANLAGYTVTEYYTVKNSHFSSPAQAVVKAQYKRGEGTSYRVLTRSGPSLLNKALERLVREESDMGRGKEREQAIITSANYRMKLIGSDPLNGAAALVLELIPKRKSPHLLNGRMWVSAADMAIEKIEGKPPVSVSFFVGRPDITREYARIGGFALARSSHAVSHSFLFGQSAVDIEYRDYHLSAPARARNSKR